MPTNFIIIRRKPGVGYGVDAAVSQDHACWLLRDGEGAPDHAAVFAPQLSPTFQRFLSLTLEAMELIDERHSLRRVLAQVALQAYLVGRRAERRRVERIARRGGEPDSPPVEVAKAA